MVTFARYVTIAYEIVDEKGLDVDNPQGFMSDLATVYNDRGHSEVSEAVARTFLRGAIM